MPYRRRRFRRRPTRRYGRVFRRRRANRPWRRRRSIRRTFRRVSAYPMRKRVTLKYHQVVFINPGAGISGKHVFQLNSCFKPDYTTTGHQPLSWDQYTPQYARYTVINTTYRVSPVAGAGDYRMATVISRDPALAFDTINNIEEQPFTQVRTFISDQASSPPIIRGKVKMRKWLDRPYWETNRTAAPSASPTMGLYLYILLWAADQTSDPGQMVVNVTLHFDVLFWDRVNDVTQD